MAGRFPSLSTLVACAALALPNAAQSATEHQERAQRWLDRHDFELPAEPSFEHLLAKGHVRIDLGIFEVFLTPDVLADSRWMPQIQKSLSGLLLLQGTWIDWVQDDSKRIKQFKADQKVLSKWISGLGKKDLGAAGQMLGTNLLEASGAKDRELAASTRFANFMRGEDALGGPLAAASSSQDHSLSFPKARLVLAPSRRDFVELTALLGVLEKDQRPFFWVHGTNIWTHIDFHGARIVALEFGDGSDNYLASVAMTYKNPDALPQHVVQLGSYALLDSYFGEKMEPMIAGGLASDMVITIYDEADTRIDGDLRARRSAGRSTFVPGGNPNGGLLPPSNAQSRWRDGQGKGFFVKLLKKSQSLGRAGAKTKWEKMIGFELRSDKGASMIFRGPILGAAATSQPPTEFKGDYLEFLRAYRAAFLHWLVNSADGSQKASRKKFAEIMNGIGLSEQYGLPELFERVYGAPLSASSGESLFVKKNRPLEGRFLLWLSKQK